MQRIYKSKQIILFTKLMLCKENMEDKKLNNQESLELITSMINKTKRQLHIGEGNLLLWWGYTSAIVALLVGTMLYLTGGHPACNWLWFLIWIVGGIGMAVINRKNKVRYEKEPTTYVDRLTSSLWCTVGLLFMLATLMSLAFLYFGKDSWPVMLIFAFVMCGFAVTMQGFILRESSMVLGGAVSLVSGTFVTCCIISHTPLMVWWIIPLFVVCFIFAMIVPGHVLNAKAKKQC